MHNTLNRKAARRRWIVLCQALGAVGLLVPISAAPAAITTSGNVTPAHDGSDPWIIGVNEGDNLFVGNTSAGSMSLTNGSLVRNFTGVIAFQTGSSGTVTVSGFDSLWYNAHNLNVGAGGSGTLTIQLFGNVNSDAGFIGTAAGSSGHVTVSNALWFNHRDLVVGRAGNGMLQILGGGSVSTIGASLGSFPDASGEINVNGTNAIFTLGSLLRVGENGAGTLRVGNGGRVSGERSVVGAGANSIGTATVSGDNSRWTNNSSLDVGIFGTGVLTIADGGRVDVGGTGGTGMLTLAVSGAGSGMLNIGAAPGDTPVAAGVVNAARVDGGTGSGGAVLNFNHNNSSYNFARSSGTPIVITGSTAVRHLGSGTTILAANNTYTGGTTISSGVLQIGNGGTSGSIPGNVVNNATLLFNRSDTLAVDGVISGSGHLRQIGFGTTILTAANTYTGGTSVGGGLIRFSQLNNFGTGSITLSGGGVEWAPGSTVDISSRLGPIGIDGGTLNTNTNSVTLAGGLSGTGALRKTGIGSLTLAGANTFAGTIVRQGTLHVTGSISHPTQMMSVGELSGDDAALLVSGGGLVSSGSASIARSAGSTGAVTLSGSSERWFNSGPIHVGGSASGPGGTGTLTMASLGTISASSLKVWNNGHVLQTNGSSRILITTSGAGVGGGLLIGGGGGSGTLEIVDGGTVSGVTAYIASGTNSIGSVLVSGAGSSWTNSIELFVASRGQGTLIVQGGADVSSARGGIGDLFGATGTAVVTGPGSSWVNAGTLSVGRVGVGTLAVSNGGLVSAGTLTSTSNDSISVSSGGMLQVATNLSNDATLTINAGSVEAGPVGGLGTILLSNGGTLLADRVRQNRLSITSSTVTIRPEGTPNGTSRLNQLQISGVPGAWTGRLDLGDNDLVIDYTGGTPLADIADQIGSGYNGGDWGGNGLAASSADGAQFGLGYAESADIFTSFPATFSGQSVDDTAILIGFTRYGDANLDGLVNLADFNRLAGNFGTGSGAVWSMGDFNYDGIVNLADFNRLASNFGLSAGPDGPTPDDWAALAAAVPEPSAAAATALFAIAASSLRPRIRRSHPVRRGEISR